MHCYRCGLPGHHAANCPELQPAATETEHRQRIATYVQRWIDNQISETEKRRLVAAEYGLWNQAKTDRRAARTARLEIMETNT